MEQHDLTFRLEGTGVPNGTLGLEALGDIAKCLQELATRIGRHVAGQRGPGRTAEQPRATTRLLLTGIAEGSTKLLIAYGERDVLPLDAGIEGQTAEKFWEILEGIQNGERPEWTPPLVAESADHVIQAIGRSAESVAVERVDGRAVRWARADVRREPWAAAAPAVTDEIVTVNGQLERVDLHTRRFRLRDDVGNTIDLHEVVDADAVGPLVGQRTSATGARVLNEQGRLISVRAPVITAAPRPDAWQPGTVADWRAILAAAPGPDPNGIEGVTVADVDEMLARLCE